MLSFCETFFLLKIGYLSEKIIVAVVFKKTASIFWRVIHTFWAKSGQNRQK
jgi:hypothetical protein